MNGQHGMAAISSAYRVSPVHSVRGRWPRLRQWYTAGGETPQARAMVVNLQALITCWMMLVLICPHIS